MNNENIETSLVLGDQGGVQYAIVKKKKKRFQETKANKTSDYESFLLTTYFPK